MAHSIISISRHSDDFREALCSIGADNVIITQKGQLRSRITNFMLGHLRLVTVQENVPRILFIRVPEDTILLSFLLSSQTVPVWAGCEMPGDGVMVVRGGESLHTRIDGAIHWCAIQFPLHDFMRFRRAVTGETSGLPGAVCVWRPAISARNTLLQLVVAAVRTTQAHWVALTEDQAVHGLEQQLIHYSLSCLTGAPVAVEKPAARRQRDLIGHFEELLQCQQQGSPRAVDLAGALGVSDRVLRKCCVLHLGVAPMHYVRLRRMQSAHRELFGEIPSRTLRGGGRRKQGMHLATSNPGKRL